MGCQPFAAFLSKGQGRAAFQWMVQLFAVAAYACSAAAPKMVVEVASLRSPQALAATECRRQNVADRMATK